MKLRITVEGVSYEVEVEVLDGGTITAPPLGAPVVPAASRASKSKSAPPLPGAPEPAAPSGAAGGEKVCKSPIAGTVTQIKVKVGDAVAVNQVVLIMEAMKMETNISSPVAGKVKAIKVKAGDGVKHGQVLVEFE